MNDQGSTASGFNRRFGFVPNVSADQKRKYACAVMIIVGADGEVSAREFEAFAEIGKIYGASEELIGELVRFDYKTARLEDYLEGLPEGEPRRAILYDCIEVASADGYHEEERACVYKAAKIMGVDPGVVAALEGIVKLEADIREMKMRLFSAKY